MFQKIKKSDEKLSIKEFDNYFQLYQEKEYKEVELLYFHIRKAYEKKFKNDKMKIKIEKMNLERNVGKYQSGLRKSQMTLFIGMFGIMVQLVLPELLKLMNIKDPIINFIFLLGFGAWLIYYIARDSDKYRPKDLMYHIALKVIEDMEKEDINLASIEVVASSATILDINLSNDDENNLKDSVNIYTFWKFKRRYNQLLKERFEEIDKIKIDKRIEHKLIEALHDKLNESYSSIIKDKETYQKEKMVIKNKIIYIQERSFQTLIPVYAIIFTLFFNFITFSQKIYETLKLSVDDQIKLLVFFMIILIAAIVFLNLLAKAQFENATRIGFYNLSLEVIEDIYKKSDFYDKNKESSE